MFKIGMLLRRVLIRGDEERRGWREGLEGEVGGRVLEGGVGGRVLEGGSIERYQVEE